VIVSKVVAKWRCCKNIKAFAEDIFGGSFMGVSCLETNGTNIIVIISGRYGLVDELQIPKYPNCSNKIRN